jgi:putative endonuclease
MEFAYVYILHSQSNRNRFYSGMRDSLRDRLRRHNAGEVPHTAKFRPQSIRTAVAFNDRDRAAQFEKYLKTASNYVQTLSIGTLCISVRNRSKLPLFHCDVVKSMQNRFGLGVIPTK